MSLQDLDEDQMSALKQVEKLHRLADSTTHPAERESALKKASDILLAYNLSASAIGSGDEGRRAQEKLKGGFYQYERDLWSGVARVNFCLHWQSQDWIERPEADRKRKKVQERYSEFAQQYRRVTRQHLVGRAINVEATKFMVSYLKDAIERELRTYLFGEANDRASVESCVVGAGEMLRSKRANDFRTGAAIKLNNRLWERRSDQEAEERRRAAAAEALRAAGGGGDGTGTALTISSLVQSEQDANLDVLYGEGWSARQRAEQAAKAAAQRAAEEEYTKWAAAHPEEARAEERRRRKEKREASKSRGRTFREKSRTVSDWGAYTAGGSAGGRIGLDPQTTYSSQVKKIGRSQ